MRGCRLAQVARHLLFLSSRESGSRARPRHLLFLAPLHRLALLAVLSLQELHALRLRPQVIPAHMVLRFARLAEQRLILDGLDFLLCRLSSYSWWWILILVLHAHVDDHLLELLYLLPQVSVFAHHHGEDSLITVTFIVLAQQVCVALFCKWQRLVARIEELRDGLLVLEVQLVYFLRRRL